MVKILLVVSYIFIMFQVYFHFFDTIRKYIVLDRLEMLAGANIGLFASLTGFLIASIPFFLQVILKKESLINTFGNNLNQITSALFILMALFIVSVVFLLLSIASPVYLYIVLSIFLYLYTLLCYYVIEIFKILKELVYDLRYLKSNMK